MEFNALSDASTGYQFQLNNESWSGKKKAGDHIKFSLLGDYKETEESQPVTVTKIVLNDQTMCQTSQ